MTESFWNMPLEILRSKLRDAERTMWRCSPFRYESICEREEFWEAVEIRRYVSGIILAREKDLMPPFQKGDLVRLSVDSSLSVSWPPSYFLRPATDGKRITQRLTEADYILYVPPGQLLTINRVYFRYWEGSDQPEEWAVQLKELGSMRFYAEDFESITESACVA